MKDTSLKAFLRFLNLIEVQEKHYDSSDCDSHFVYVFKNKDEYIDYFISNGVYEVDDSLLSICRLCLFKSGKIVAMKNSCDHFITYLRRPKKLSNEEINNIHERGLITPNEMVMEWENNNYCPIEDSRRCNLFDTCHDCLLSYSCDKNEYDHFKIESDSIYVRKRTIKK